MLPRFWVASAKRCKDAGSARIRSDTGATEDAAARRVIAGQKHGGHSLEGHYGKMVTLRWSVTRAVLPSASVTSWLRWPTFVGLTWKSMNRTYDPPARM